MKFLGVLLLALFVFHGHAHQIGGAAAAGGHRKNNPDAINARLWVDTDGDGIPDRRDPDMDNDGVPNVADEFPLDKSTSGVDSDGDGLADFIDLNLKAQKDIFRETGVVVIHGTGRFTTTQWAVLREVLMSSRMRFAVRTLKAVVAHSDAVRTNFYASEYDADWAQATFYPAPADEKAMTFRGRLLHELGHADAAARPDAYEAFARDWHAWNPISDYGATNPVEGYAENFVWDLFMEHAFTVDTSRFNRWKRPLPGALTE